MLEDRPSGQAAHVLLAGPCILTLPSHTAWPHLSCGAVRHILGSFSLGDLHLLAGDAGPGQRGTQEVAVLIQRAGLDGRPDELLHELLADVLDEHLQKNSPWEGALARTGHCQNTESPMACASKADVANRCLMVVLKLQ